MNHASACRSVRAVAGILAILGQVSCSGSQPTTPTTTHTGPLTITGATSLGETNQSVQLTLLAGSLDATRTAMWQSSDVSVASVSSGLVQAIGLGTVTISASYLNQTASTSLSVVPGELCAVYDSSNVILNENSNDVPTPSWSVGAPVASGLYEWFVAGDNMRDANNLLALFRRYNQSCLVGHTTHNNRSNRAQYTFTYFKNPTGMQTTISPEDCVAYSAGALQIVDQGVAGSALMSNGTQLALLDTHFDAALLSAIAGQYSNECFIGRGNARPNPYDYITEYWK